MTAPQVTAGAAVAEAASAAASMSGHAAQSAIQAALLRDVTRLWASLDKKRISDTFPGWLRAMMLLTRGYHSQSREAAGRSYRQLRQAHTQSAAPRSLIHLAPPPSEEWMSRAFGFSGPGMLNKDTARPNTALTSTLGTAQRIVGDGARTTIIDTVHADPVAVGWYRVTDGDPCAFCGLLAGRGLAYKSERRAAFQAHNGCGCTAAPAFTRDHRLPDLSIEADRIYREATRGAKSGTQLNAFRRAWESRSAG